MYNIVEAIYEMVVSTTLLRFRGNFAVFFSLLFSGYVHEIPCLALLFFTFREEKQLFPVQQFPRNSAVYLIGRKNINSSAACNREGKCN